MYYNLPLHVYLFILLSAIIFTTGVLFLAKRFLKKENNIDLVIRILSAFLFVFAVTNRVIKTYFYIEIQHLPDFSWWMLLPDTICSLVAHVLPIALLIKPRESAIVHGIIYISFVGGICGIFIPAYFAEWPLEVFWISTSVSSFLMHTFLVMIPLLIFVIKRFEPKMKTWYYTIIAYGITMLLGVFEIYVLHFPPEAHVMNILTPLIAKLPVLTSWYILWVGYGVGVTIFLFIYERFVKKKECLAIIKEMNPFIR